MIKTGYFLIKQITQKNTIIKTDFFQLNYVGTHFFMTVCAFGGHWMQKYILFQAYVTNQ